MSSKYPKNVWSVTLADFDADQFKAQFPIFNAAENRSLVYLDNAATTQRPQCMVDAVSHFYTHSNANAHRSSHRLSRDATNIVENTRKTVASFINTVPEQIVFTSGATMAMNIAVAGVCESLVAGDEIILSVVEHHANIVPWQQQAEKRGLKISYLPIGKNIIDLGQLPKLITDKTRVVCLSAASNVLGSLLDIASVKRSIAGKAIMLGLDLAQYIGHQSVDVEQLGCDFAVFSAHKMYGPNGVGVLWASSECLSTWSPFMFGGEMIEHVDLHASRFREGYAKFETGTANVAGIAGFGVVLQWLLRLDRQAMHNHETKLLHYAHQQCAAIPGIELLTSPDDNVGVLSFVPSSSCQYAIGDIVNWLDESDIAVRAGVMCAEPLATVLGHSAIIRISLAAYNNYRDIDRLVTSLQALFLEQSSESILGIDSLLSVQGWQARYRMIMQWGADMAPNNALRNDNNLVKGCETAVWLELNCHDGVVNLQLDADSRVMRGLCMILLRLFDKQAVATINEEKILQQLADLQLQKHLTNNRSNGFMVILKSIFAALHAR